ncbi:hypothetical protein ACFXTO_044285 [Malus domestica]
MELLLDAAAVGIGSAVVHRTRRASSTAAVATAAVVIAAIAADVVADIVTEESTSSNWKITGDPGGRPNGTK